MLEPIIFYSLAVLTLGSAVAVVTLRNVLHSALMLGLCLFGVAGLFASLGADFLFAAQIIVYVGGIAVLILFVVLLAARHSELVLRQTNSQWFGGLLLAAAAVWCMARYVRPWLTQPAMTEPGPTTAALARLLLTDLAVPFEFISLILLAALAGAVLFSRHNEA